MKSESGGWLRHLDISRFLQWRYNTYLTWILPLSWMQAYVSVLGKLYYYLNKGERRRIHRNVCTVLGRHEKDPEVIKTVRETFAGIFAHYAEKLFVAYSRFKRTCLFLNNRVSLEGQGVLDKALADGKGAILVTGHYGAVEFLPLALALNGYTVTMLLRFKTKNLKRTLVRRSVGVPITLVDVDEGRGVLFEALKALKSNQIIITECDEFEKWRPCKFRHNRFLGRKVPFDRTLDMLHRRSKSPVVMGIVQRQSGQRYRLNLHLLKDSQGAPETTTVSQKSLEILERYIFEAPHQWYQWKDASQIIGPQINEEPRTRAVEDDRYIPLEDTPVHVF